MTTISAFEAKTRFEDLLERVSRGEEIVITKHEKPVARLIPEGKPALSEIREAVNELARLRDEMAKRPGRRGRSVRQRHPQSYREGPPLNPALSAIGNGGFVADASVGVSWAVSAQSSAATGILLDEVVAGRPFVIPGLWMFEVGERSFGPHAPKKNPASAVCFARVRAMSELQPDIDEDGPRLALHRIWELADELSTCEYTMRPIWNWRSAKISRSRREMRGLRRAAAKCGIAILLVTRYISSLPSTSMSLTLNCSVR